jgi:hypothetical protein
MERSVLFIVFFCFFSKFNKQFIKLHKKIEVLVKAEHDFYREKEVAERKKTRSSVTSHHFERMTHNIVRVSFSTRVRRNILSLFMAYFSAFHSFE